MENKPDKEQELLHAVNEIAESIHHLRNTAYYHYATLVKQVMQNKITGEMNIELIMDGLLDFCDEDRFIEIYRQLCRHVYYKYPSLVGEHVALFRAIFETNDEESNKETKPSED